MFEATINTLTMIRLAEGVYSDPFETKWTLDDVTAVRITDEEWRRCASIINGFEKFGPSEDTADHSRMIRLNAPGFFQSFEPHVAQGLVALWIAPR
jgi:hypothetical protein